MYISHNEIIGGAEYMPFLLESTAAPVTTPADGVDMTALNALEDAQVEGEPDLVVELIDLYLEDAADKLAVIREASARRDETQLRRAAHSLRGSSASLGAHRVAALCGELERVDCADPLRVESLRIRFEQECGIVRRVFAAERRKRS